MTLPVNSAPDSIKPTQWELDWSKQFSSAKFAGELITPNIQPGLLVLANNDPLQLNERNGRPMCIGDKQFTRGLYAHAVSKVLVQLPGPGKAFKAIAGPDNNENTSGGRGSIALVVRVNDQEKFRSSVMRGGDTGVAIDVALDGAQDFYLEVEDAGDGISCDQASWGDARVELENGDVVWLGDLPILGDRTQVFKTVPPFEFTWDGRSFRESLSEWTVERSVSDLDAMRKKYTVTYTHPTANLQVRCEAIEYNDFPVVEWTAWVKNTGTGNSPVIKDLQALDETFERSLQGDFSISYEIGSICAQNDFEPHVAHPKAGEKVRLTAVGGRGSDGIWPYFNTDFKGRGLITVVGWPGQWAADFIRDDELGMRFIAGQETTDFYLKPGEEVRTPLMALLFWYGEVDRAQNMFRRWMVDHNVPRPGGVFPEGHYAACSSHQYGEMIHADTQSQIMFIDRYLDHGLKLDYWWMDAGWYPNDWGWPHTGTWEVDQTRFPGGFRPITDHGRSRDVQTIVWFEPERVTPGTWLYDNHPEWLLGRDGEQKLLNLGNPEALQWLINHIDGIITKEGIDFYRQDFNMEPLPHWRGADTPDRKGITENHHVTGYLAYWDELKRRHPNMLIDSCASGGRRNDLETMRRAVPLLRSDYIFEPIGQQAHTYGLAKWLPVFGTGFNSPDPYMFRSALCTYLNTCWDVRNDANDWDAMRARINEWNEVKTLLRGDFYPLTKYTRDNDAWMAWQFNQRDQDAGVIQAYRRAESAFEVARFKLQGLDPATMYEVRDFDDGVLGDYTGEDLMNGELRIEMPKAPQARLIVYRAK